MVTANRNGETATGEQQWNGGNQALLVCQMFMMDVNCRYRLTGEDT